MHSRKSSFLVLERTPEALGEDVVHVPAPTVHGDGDAGVLGGGGELQAGELAAVVGIEDLRPAVALQGFCEGLYAEAGIEGVGPAARRAPGG